MSLKKANWSDLFHDSSLWALIVVNLLIILLAVSQHWSLLTIMWIYWSQSVIIGLFNVIRILRVRCNVFNFGFIGMPITVQVDSWLVKLPCLFQKFFSALFFMFHYGGFHMYYGAMLVIGTFSYHLPQIGGIMGVITGPVAVSSVLIGAGIFFVNHLFSFISNSRRDYDILSFWRLMLYPYARILPMHLTFTLGVSLGPMALPFFLALKTVADVVMHVVEHRL